MKTSPKLPEFSPNLADAKELSALGINNLLTTYEKLTKALQTEPSAQDKDHRKTYSEQLRAGLAFLFAAASCSTRREFASADFDRALPKSERAAVQVRATRLVDSALAALKAYDPWAGF
jgi:hypothetical protein